MTLENKQTMIKLVNFSLEYLDLSWEWLNDPEIKLLTNTADFTKEEQLSWFNVLKSRSDYLIWGVEFEFIPIGVAGIKNITNKDCEYWGYIGNKAYWGKGLGMQIMGIIEEKVREIGLKSIYLQVFSGNERAIRLYKKMNYNKVAEKNSMLIMRKNL